MSARSLPTARSAFITGRPASMRWARMALAVAALLGSRAVPAVAQEAVPGPTAAAAPAVPCARIGRIDIRNNSLFAPEEIRSKSWGWALGAVNHIHYRTRSDYLRKALLVTEGGCYDEAALQASVRNIRDLDFIARAEATSSLLQDSTWAVALETWDEWSTTANVDFDVENSFQFKGFLLAESNAFGRGLKASFRSRTFREQRNNNFTLATTRLFGTRSQASIAGGTTRIGEFWRQDVWRNFQTEGPEQYYQSRLQYEDREEAYLTGELKGLTHVVLPLRDRFWYARTERRFGRPGALAFVGAEADVLHRTVTGPARQVFDRDFGEASEAPDSIAAKLASQDDPESWVKLGASVGIRRIRFGTARGLDLIAGTQNVAHGSELGLTVGRTLGTWSTAPLSSYARFTGYASTPDGPVLLNGTLDASVRRLDHALPGESPWRDLAVGGRGLVYLRPADADVIVASVRLNLRRNVDLPYQVALGGEEGVRGYNEEDLPTSSLVVFSAENRLNLPWFRPAVGLGLTAFADYGKGWKQDVPFGLDTGWRAGMGGGIRIAFPAGSGTVTRLEIAWPIDGQAGDRGPVIRTYWSPVRTRR